MQTAAERGVTFDNMNADDFKAGYSAFRAMCEALARYKATPTTATRDTYHAAAAAYELVRPASRPRKPKK